MKYTTSDLIFLSILRKKNHVTRGIFHDIPPESTAKLIYPMPLTKLTFLFDVWFQEFKIKVKTGVFFFHVLVVDSNFF